MYYVHVGSLKGTCLVVFVEQGVPSRFFTGVVLASNMNDYKEGSYQVLDGKYFTKVDTTSINVAIQYYEKEKKRIRNMSLINNQFSDK